MHTRLRSKLLNSAVFLGYFVLRVIKQSPLITSKYYKLNDYTFEVSSFFRFSKNLVLMWFYKDFLQALKNYVGWIGFRAFFFFFNEYKIWFFALHEDS